MISQKIGAQSVHFQMRTAAPNFGLIPVKQRGKNLILKSYQF